MRIFFADSHADARAYMASAKNGYGVNGAENDGDYNPEDRWDEYYMTCAPWIEFSAITHPIPDMRESQSVSRVC